MKSLSYLLIPPTYWTAHLLTHILLLSSTVLVSILHTMSKAKKEAGDKVFVGGSPQDRAVLVNDIIECMHQIAPKRLVHTSSTLQASFAK
jgi:hypothetical protein